MPISKYIAASLVIFCAGRAHAFIVGGSEVSANDPVQSSTTALYEPSGTGPGGALCSASLIGPNMAITAAHCIQKNGYAPVMLFGNDIRSGQAVRRPVVGSIVNPAWAKRAGRGMDQGDIAVVKFAGGLPTGYRPAPMDSSDDQIVKGEQAVLAGYGINNAEAKTGAGVLRKTEVKVANPRPGKTEMVLNQRHGRGACHGDSGGPAYVQRGGKMVLAGVTNRSYPASAPDDCAHDVVYTKVAAYRPWIESSEAKLRAQDHASGSASGGDTTSFKVRARLKGGKRHGKPISSGNLISAAHGAPHGVAKAKHTGHQMRPARSLVRHHARARARSAMSHKHSRVKA